MKSKRVGVVKVVAVVALVALPVGLAVAVAKAGQQHKEERAKAATRALLAMSQNRSRQMWDGQKAQKLIAEGADVNVQADDGIVPLHEAVGYDTETARFLLDRGADANARTIETRYSALLMAVDAGNVESVRLLLSRRADPNLAADFGGYKKHPLAVARMLLASREREGSWQAQHGNTPTPPGYKKASVYREITQLLKAAGAKE